LRRFAKSELPGLAPDNSVTWAHCGCKNSWRNRLGRNSAPITERNRSENLVIEKTEK